MSANDRTHQTQTREPKRGSQTAERRWAAFQKAGFAERVRLARPVVQSLMLAGVDLTTCNRTEVEPMLDDLVLALAGLDLPEFVTENLDNDSSRLEAFEAYAGVAYTLGVAVGLKLSPDVFADGGGGRRDPDRTKRATR